MTPGNPFLVPFSLVLGLEKWNCPPPPPQQGGLVILLFGTRCPIAQMFCTPRATLSHLAGQNPVITPGEYQNMVVVGNIFPFLLIVV